MGECYADTAVAAVRALATDEEDRYGAMTYVKNTPLD